MQDSGPFARIKTSWIIAVLVLMVVVFISFTLYQNIHFRITGTNPSVGGVATLSPYFKINFNKTLVASSVSITTPDGLLSDDYSVSGKTITLPLAYPLNDKTTYTITLKSAKSSDGKIISNRVFSFTPQDIDSSDLPADQQKALLNAQDKGQSPALSDPIINHLPHTTPDYSLSSLISSDDSGQTQLTLSATIYLSQADMGDPASAQAQYEQEVQDYIRSLGLDPTKYVINYTTQQL